uniref:Uncharacterized protein n=1 Tax=Sipha flava TaxID=143950 RepID=A0A2S2QK49_9HEMI
MALGSRSTAGRHEISNCTGYGGPMRRARPAVIVAPPSSRSRSVLSPTSQSPVVCSVFLLDNFLSRWAFQKIRGRIYFYYYIKKNKYFDTNSCYLLLRRERYN